MRFVKTKSGLLLPILTQMRKGPCRQVNSLRWYQIKTRVRRKMYDLNESRMDCSRRRRSFYIYSSQTKVTMDCCSAHSAWLTLICHRETSPAPQLPYYSSATRITMLTYWLRPARRGSIFCIRIDSSFLSRSVVGLCHSYCLYQCFRAAAFQIILLHYSPALTIASPVFLHPFLV
ncbi:hypothetical protein WG66_003688, partial [Moniliophthora roreri]